MSNSYYDPIEPADIWGDLAKKHAAQAARGEKRVTQRICHCGHKESDHVMEMWVEGGFSPHEVCKNYKCICGIFEAKK
jgi:hypothetical protein